MLKIKKGYKNEYLKLLRGALKNLSYIHRFISLKGYTLLKGARGKVLLCLRFNI